MNLKDKIKAIIIGNDPINSNTSLGTMMEQWSDKEIEETFIEFAKLACEEQKRICSRVLPGIDSEGNNNILNSPTVKFD